MLTVALAVRVITSNRDRPLSILPRQEVPVRDIALTKQATATVERASHGYGRSAHHALSRRGVDGARAVVQHAGGLSRRSGGAGRWLHRSASSALPQTGARELMDFIAARVQAGARPRSTARQLSSFRRFFRYLMREGLMREDPTAQIAMPKIGRSLPRSLSEAEVEALLARPGRGRSARLSRPHHARGAVCDRPARLGAGAA